ncbi:MAG: M28 family peptidase [Acidobacteriota bacterium]|nr:M28 family peptidase [Acidobacteriota bacterium]
MSYFIRSACFVLVLCWCAQSALAQNTEAIIKRLASAEFAGRATKTAGNQKAAEFISTLFREAGLKPMSGAQPNVAGLVEGKTRKDEFVIVAAHFDGFGGEFAGAMDNAASVAVMIEMARALAKQPPQRSVLFLAFDGGEQDNSGVKAYANRPLVPLDKTVAAINLSGFGGGFGDQLHETLFVIGAEFSPQLAAAVTKHKRSEAWLAMVGDDVTQFAGAEHLHFKLGQLPTISITNGIHYAYHTKADVPGRINFPALEKHAAALTKLTAEIANTPKIEQSTQPKYDADEAAEWHRLLTALRENVLKTSANSAGQSQIDDVLLDLKRFAGRAITATKAREAVILRAASLCFYIANPNGVEYNSLLNVARSYEQKGDRAQAVASYQKLLKWIETEYRRDDQTVADIRARIIKLSAK